MRHGVRSGHFMVNILCSLHHPHRLRMRMMEKLGYLDKMVDTELEHVFDKTVAAVLKLMQDSYSRFKETAVFKKHEEKAMQDIHDKEEIKEEDIGGFMGDLVM